MCDTIEIKKEISQLVAQAESLRTWLTDNPWHLDREKVFRELNTLNCKITAKEQRIERFDYPKRFKDADEVTLPKYVR
jgi:tRNA A22 N-methylase